MGSVFDQLTASNTNIQNKGKTAEVLNYSNVKVTNPQKTGKLVAEILVDKMLGLTIGVGNANSRSQYPGSDDQSYGWTLHTNYIYHRGTYTTTAKARFVSGDICGVCLDYEKKMISYYHNGVFIVQYSFNSLQGAFHIEIGSGGAGGGVVSLLTKPDEMYFYNKYPTEFMSYDKSSKLLIISNKETYSLKNNRILNISKEYKKDKDIFKNKGFISAKSLINTNTMKVFDCILVKEMSYGKLYKSKIIRKEVSKINKVCEKHKQEYKLISQIDTNGLTKNSYKASSTFNMDHPSAAFDGVLGFPAGANDVAIGKTDTKQNRGIWFSLSGSNKNQWIQVSFNRKRSVNKIRFYNAYRANNKRNPQDCVLQGSNNGIVFEDIVEFTIPYISESYDLNINKVKGFTTFRLFMKNNYGDPYLGIGELQLFESTDYFLVKDSKGKILSTLK